MNGAFYIGSVGLQSQQRALDVVANNLANINTVGFKRSEMRFTQLVNASGGEDGPNGVMTQAATPVFSQGEIRLTGSTMDVAVDGDGFLELRGPDGASLLWRGGTLSTNSDGYLVSAGNGLPLKAMISIPREAKSIRIDRDGQIWALSGDDGRAEEIGRLEVVRARDSALSAPLNGGLYRVENEADLMSANPGEDGAGVIVQGAVEGSNVVLADQMVTLMILQRAFAANAQALQAGDQLMAIANGLRR